MQENSSQPLGNVTMGDICRSRVGNRRSILPYWLGPAWIAALLAGCGGSSPPPEVDIGSVLDSRSGKPYLPATAGFAIPYPTATRRFFPARALGKGLFAKAISAMVEGRLAVPSWLRTTSCSR